LPACARRAALQIRNPNAGGKDVAKIKPFAVAEHHLQADARGIRRFDFSASPATLAAIRS
jgi:hypothetical protein